MTAQFGQSLISLFYSLIVKKQYLNISQNIQIEMAELPMNICYRNVLASEVKNIQTK